MKWLAGRPNGLLPLGDWTFRHRGQVTFQIERVCRVIDSQLAKRDRIDAAYLERKAVRA
jgi:hypothetical protein